MPVNERETDFNFPAAYIHCCMRSISVKRNLETNELVYPEKAYANPNLKLRKPLKLTYGSEINDTIQYNTIQIYDPLLIS